MEYLVAIIIGYLLGSSSMSFYISKIKKINLKQNGSKNYGASNTLIMIGKKEAIIVLLHDILKTVLAVKIIEIIYPELIYANLMAGLFSILGHIFPFYLKFDGGKGFASYIGLIFAMNYKIGIIILIMIIIVSLLSDYIVVGTFSTILISPIILSIINNDYKILIMMYIVSIIIIFKHKENIKKIIKKEEPGIRKNLFKKKK